MHAIVCSEFALLERLAYRRLPAHEMGGGQVRIAVRAAGVNFPDALIERRVSGKIVLVTGR
ncbi:MAG TPA: hypothetical protein VGM74_15460 [Burkholderiaceae bacterium]|jgi:NADPH2:quinone reductase